jgi:SH3 domain-containing YSC84-like protein 1
VGRSAEASGTANLAAIYSYSKSKGLFVGISIEGSVLIERKETNKAFYGKPISSREILSGSVPAPIEAEELYRALNKRSALEVQQVQRRASSASFRNTSAGSQGSESRVGGMAGFTTSSLNRYNSKKTAPPPPPPPRKVENAAMTKQSDTVTAQFDYLGEREGDLTFRKGDLITVLERNPNQWWRGRRVNGEEGVFPANYVS